MNHHKTRYLSQQYCENIYPILQRHNYTNKDQRFSRWSLFAVVAPMTFSEVLPYRSCPPSSSAVIAAADQHITENQHMIINIQSLIIISPTSNLPILHNADIGTVVINLLHISWYAERLWGAVIILVSWGFTFQSIDGNVIHIPMNADYHCSSYHSQGWFTVCAQPMRDVVTK